MDFARDAIDTLRSAAFPVFAIPPAQWPGDVMVGGVSGNTQHPLSIHMRYDDDLLIEHPSRRIQITSTGPEDLSNRAPSDSFLLWEHSYTAEILNFVHNISTERLPERAIPGSERFTADIVDGKRVPRTVHLPSAGPRRLIDAVPFADDFQTERVAFVERPELRLYRTQMPVVEILVLALGWDDEPLTEFMSAARCIGDDEGLFAEIERAEYAAWEKITQRKRRRAAE